MKYTCSNSNRDAGGAALGLTTRVANLALSAPNFSILALFICLWLSKLVLALFYYLAPFWLFWNIEQNLWLNFSF